MSPEIHPVLQPPTDLQPTHEELSRKKAKLDFPGGQKKGGTERREEKARKKEDFLGGEGGGVSGHVMVSAMSARAEPREELRRSYIMQEFGPGDSGSAIH